MLYKSETIEFLTDDIKVSNLCVYNDYYYFETDVELEQAEIVSEEEFAEAVNAIIPAESLEPIEPVEPEPTQLDRIEANTTALLGNESALDVLLGVE